MTKGDKMTECIRCKKPFKEGDKVIEVRIGGYVEDYEQCHALEDVDTTLMCIQCEAPRAYIVDSDVNLSEEELKEWSKPGEVKFVEFNPAKIRPVAKKTENTCIDCDTPIPISHARCIPCIKKEVARTVNI